MDPDKRCVFPFKYNGNWFTKCTNYGAKSYWCPTEAANGTSRNWNKWGWCEENCPMEQKGNYTISMMMLV